MQSMQAIITEEVLQAAFPLQVGQTQSASNVGRLYLRRAGNNVGVIRYDFQPSYCTLKLTDAEDNRTIKGVRPKYEQTKVVEDFLAAVRGTAQWAVEQYPSTDTKEQQS